MSSTRFETVTCPSCGVQGSVEVIESLNGTLNPGQRRALLAGELLLFRCASCGQEARIDFPLLYHDMNARFMIWCVSATWERAGFQPTALPAGSPADEATPENSDGNSGHQEPAYRHLSLIHI